MNDALRAEFAAFHTFSTVKFFGQQSDAIAPVTAAKYADHLRGWLGWLHRERGVPLHALAFASVLPSSERVSVAITFAYLQWLRAARGTSVRTEGLAVRAVMHAAKFLFHSESKVCARAGQLSTPSSTVMRALGCCNHVPWE